ncbi:two-component regulator propeller domain-containing protein [Ekhidna sp.]|jgi:signal transduction histidine kinase/ligand-binding sensor domain-containing protein|uniref:sensor histidine kinase n=1 Tax=Ekhidna sp. TaxID=2608089 RepID=UPI0032EF0B6A
MSERLNKFTTRVNLLHKISVAFFAVSFGLCEVVNGQPLDSDKRLTQYVLRSWNTEDGLTSESVNEMVQTRDGYLWIGTYTGLHRFDGKDFTLFTSRNSDLPASNVLRIEKGSGNELWLGTLHGVAIYKDGEFSVPSGLELVKHLSIEEMLITQNGDLWFSTKSNSLFRYKDGELEEFTQTFQVEKSTILSIEEDRSGNVYFGTDDSRLLKYSPDEELQNYQLDQDINGINTLLHFKGLIYMGTGNGLFLWDGTELIESPILKNTTIKALLFDSEEMLWLGTMKGLFRHNQSSASLDSLTEQTGMPNNIVEDLLFDSEGNLWVGTYRSGIFFLGDGSITSFTKNDGLASNIISSITEIDENTFLLGNENGKLNLLKDGRVSEFIPPVPIPKERLKNLFTDSKGRIWVSTYGGLVVIDGNKGYRYTVASGFPDNFVRLAYEDHEGTIWIGTKNTGLLLFENGRLDNWAIISIDEGLTSNYILSVEQNDDQEMIIGTISGLNIIKDRKIIKTVTVEDGLPSNFMFATHATSRFIWIASNDGLSGYNGKDIVNFSSENGMPTNIIYDVLEDDKGNLWMPSENAILSVKRDELEAAADDPTVQLNVKQYDESYGMKNSHCLGAVLSYEDSQGRFWIPTIGGIVRLDPEQIKPPTFRPKMLLEDIYADNKLISLKDEIIVPARTSRLSIDFTGISYAQTDLLQFRYRLVPFDDDWVMGSEERNATYTNLSPGRYIFELQSGVEGAFFDRTLSKEIIISAAWWQTIWAKVLMVIFVVCIGLLLYWVRMNRLRSNNLRLENTVKIRTQEIEEQKQELSRAIEQLKQAQEQMIQSDKMASLGILAAGVAHEINNPLNFIQGGVDGLEQKLKKSKKIKKEDYGLLIGAIKEGISRASTIVSSLNEFSHASDKKLEPCDIYHLIDNCLTMIRYRLKNGIDLEKEFSDEPAIVMGNNGKLHQAFLNIITNSIQAIEKTGTIKIKTTLKNGKVTIEFVDSGEGIKPEHLKKITEPFFSTKEPGKGTGLGLSITYSIINEHGGTLNYTSEWGKGTTATIVLPLIKK